ncbi:PL29 family lyase N-terminal domain-containing protein, partial [Bacteroides uniformis]
KGIQNERLFTFYFFKFINLKFSIMNKKFLSVILFSALMVGTTGTFTSCKDYDDDIDQINNELTEIKSSLSALQAKVDAGKYVTNVTKSGDGIVVTWNDGTSSTIETIKGDKGDKGDKVTITIDPTSKNWMIDGIDTGICAEGKDGAGTSGTNGVDAKSPSISETTGNWVVYAWDSEKQEYVGTDTGVSAKGASAYVVDKGNYYELNVAVDKAGSAYTTVKLPKTPVVITEIEVLGQIIENADGSAKLTAWGNAGIPYNFTLVSKAQAKAWNDLDGSKKLKENQALSTLSNSDLLIRIAPAALDASEFSFKMVNSKLGEAPMTLGAPEAFNGLLTRAVSGNGLWKVAVSANEGETYKDNAAYNANFTYKSNPIAYALQEADGFATTYNLSFKYDNSIDLTAEPVSINDEALATLPNTTPVTVGEMLTVEFDNPQNVYDAYIEIDEATQVRWGITDIEGLSFKVGKLADNITTTYFPIIVHYVTLDGNTASTTYNIKPAKTLNGVTVLESQNIEISATAANNKKDYSLTPMFEDLAGSALILWKADVEDKAITVYRVESTGDVVEAGLANAVTFDKSALKDITKLTLNVDAARTTAYKLDKSYYAKIDFKDANGEILNTVKVPFTLSIPALSKFLVKENVVFGTTSTGKAYMNTEDLVTPAAGTPYASRYAFKHAFNKFDNVYANSSTITFAIDPAQKINNAAVANTHAKLTDASTSDVAIELIGDKAYHTPINIVISDAKYLGIYAYGETERAANAFKLDVMSPIEQGTVEAASAAGISVVATSEGVAKLYEKDFKAATYAGIAYKIFKDKFAATGDTEATLYTSPYISDVTFESANTNVFTVEKNGVGAKKNGNKVEEGYVEVTPKNAGYDTTEKLNVTVKDIWGYTKKADINVTVKPNSAN